MKKSDRVRNHNEKQGWGESSPQKRGTGGDFIMRKSDGVNVHHEK